MDSQTQQPRPQPHVAPPTWIIMPVLAGPEMTLAAISDCLAQSVPTTLLVVAQGVDDAFRRTLEQLAEHEPERVFCWFYEPMLPSLSAVWNTALDFVWGCGGEAALVVNNDVRLHRKTVEHLDSFFAHTQALFVSAVGVTAEQFATYDGAGPMFTAPDDEGWGHPLNPGGPDFSCFLLRRDGHAKYRFDESFQPAYCVTPDTPILTRDLRWVPIGDLSVGAEIIGVDEQSSRAKVGGYERRCYRTATITSTSRRTTHCFRVTLADGRTVVCSTDHKWLAKVPTPGNKPYEWRATNRLTPGWRIAAPLNTWTAGTNYIEGWLAGIIEGEGTLRAGLKNRCEVQIAQKAGSVFDRAQMYLASLGIPFTSRIRKDNSVGIIEVAVRRHALRLLGITRPYRLLSKFVPDGLSIFSRSAPMDLAITKIEDAGEQEVVTIETSTGTYIANGLIAHNCEDLDTHRRYLLGGDGHRIFSVNLPFLHLASGTLKTLPDERRARVERQIEAGSRTHYAKKWGGPVNQERWTIPFDATTDQDGVTTPELQRAGAV